MTIHLRPRQPEEAKKANQATPRKPARLRMNRVASARYDETRGLIREHRFVTVCGGAVADMVFAASTAVFRHNLGTISRLYASVRPGARYYQSLRLRDDAERANPQMFTKSRLMVGLGETMDEARQVMDNLRAAYVDFLTAGQHLWPAVKHHPIDRYWTPEEFVKLEEIAQSGGFPGVSATPITRFCFHAGEDFAALKQARDHALKENGLRNVGGGTPSQRFTAHSVGSSDRTGTVQAATAAQSEPK